MFLDLAQYADDFGYIEPLTFFLSGLMFRFLSIFELIFANMDGKAQLHCFSYGYPVFPALFVEKAFSLHVIVLMPVSMMSHQHISLHLTLYSVSTYSYGCELLLPFLQSCNAF